jgi:hypothetical protein
MNATEERALRWALRWTEAHRLVDEAKPAKPIQSDIRRCYLCRRNEQQLGITGVPRGFWVCPECKAMPPSGKLL